MKITAIKAYPVWVGIRNQLLVKVETDEGIHGWGESGLSGREMAVIGRARALPRVPHRPRPDAHRRALAGDVSQPVLRGRPRADRRHLGDRHRAPRHRAARRWACRSTSSSAASSATACRPSRPPRAEPGPAMIDQGRLLMEQGWTCFRLTCAGPRARRPSSSRASRSPSRRAGWSRRARRWARRSARHRLPPPPLRRRGGLVLPADAVRHARLPRGADPRRDAGGLRGAAPPDRRAVRHRRGVLQQVAVPAVHRARDPPVRPGRHLQRRRLHRGDEGRRLERGALHRPDAAQPAGPGLHRGDGPPGRGRAELRLARVPLHARPRRWGSTTGSSSRSSSSSTAPSTWCPTGPAWASRSTRLAWRARRSGSGRRRICAGATARYTNW